MDNNFGKGFDKALRLAGWTIAIVAAIAGWAIIESIRWVVSHLQWT